jgi:hypothetical protein
LNFRRATQTEVVFAMSRLSFCVSGTQGKFAAKGHLPVGPVLPRILPQLFIDFIHPLLPQWGMRVVRDELSNQRMEVVPLVCSKKGIENRIAMGINRRYLAFLGP